VELLNDEQIELAVAAREIFADGSDVDEECFRGAAYDVRVSDDVILADEPPNRRRPRQRPVVLKPGGVAFVATLERFALDWTISANISPKFRTVREGLLVLHGGLIDPGFGRPADGGNPEGNEGLPLRFLVANVSSEDVIITPRETRLATVQFTRIQNPRTLRDSSPDAELDVADEPTLGLEFFKQIASVREDVERVKLETQNVVVFGIYLLGFATIGAVAAVIVAVLTNEQPAAAAKVLRALPRSWFGWAIAVIVGASLVVALGGRVRRTVRSGRDSGRTHRAIVKTARLHAVRVRANLQRQVIKQQRERRKMRHELEEVRQMLKEAGEAREQARRLIDDARRAGAGRADPGAGPGD
jgi:deoxycytidine triphosphate deaminase